MQSMKRFVTIFEIGVFLLSCLLAVYLFRSFPLDTYIHILGPLAYLGVFITGMLYVYSLSAVVGITLLLLFGHTLFPMWVALIAGLGAACADLILFVMSRSIYTHLRAVPRYPGKALLVLLSKKKQSQWIVVLIAVIIFMLPIPDEISISSMSMLNIHKYQVFIISFVCNSLGMWILLTTFHF